MKLLNRKSKTNESNEPIDMCNQPELTNAFTSLQKIKDRVQESEFNIQIYLTKLDGIVNVDKSKMEEIVKEKERLEESMKEIQFDLDNLDNIEKALLKACPTIKQKRKK